MILELKYINVVPKDEKFKVHDKEKLTINYNSYADIKAQEGIIKRFKAELSTLVIWGTHGSASNLCNLTAKDIESLVGVLSGAVFNTIVLDACESALYAKAFASLLSEKGIILCHIGICHNQIMTYNNIQENQIRANWQNLFDDLLGLFVPGSPIKQAAFPAICPKSGNMHHLIIDGMECECTVEEKKKYPEKYENAFSPDDLDKNVGNTKSCVVTEKQAFFKFMD